MLNVKLRHEHVLAIAAEADAKVQTLPHFSADSAWLTLIASQERQERCDSKNHND